MCTHAYRLHFDTTAKNTKTKTKKPGSYSDLNRWKEGALFGARPRPIAAFTCIQVQKNKKMENESVLVQQWMKQIALHQCGNKNTFLIKKKRLENVKFV